MTPLWSLARIKARQVMRGWRRRARTRNAVPGALPPCSADASANGATVTFRCNLCGAPNTCLLAELAREVESCRRCGSTVRTRAVGELVVRELAGVDTPLHALPPRKDLAVLGLSDEPHYADWLALKFDYQNTWLHRAPRLDIANLPAGREGRYDLVIASEVFEHVESPVGRAFANARRLLRAGGKLVCTVPFGNAQDTVEHFPDLHAWKVCNRGGQWLLENRTTSGELQTFDQLVFHGGPGTTLEMRFFSLRGLERAFAEAGFARIRVAGEPVLRFGIHWPDPWSVPIVAYAD